MTEPVTFPAHEAVPGPVASPSPDRAVGVPVTAPTDALPAPISALSDAGVAIWLDQLAELARAGATTDDAIVRITTDDVRTACDVLRPVHEATGGQDGRVSIEVDPRLARDTDGTLTAARRLWATVDRPNLFIKIPATVEGLPAITAAVAEGISVNVTLIFSLERYEAVIGAYRVGLEHARNVRGLDLAGIASVASFFVSRVDTAIDPLLDALGSPQATDLRGSIAVANARLAYRLHTRSLESPAWRDLLAAGARPQRPLWASTGVKNPAYPDTLYVDELIASGVVNTMPRPTLDAVADHGRIARDTITSCYAEDDARMTHLAEAGIDIAAITDALEIEGLDKFVTSWQVLLKTVEHGLGTQR
jgi:transaldolase